MTPWHFIVTIGNDGPPSSIAPDETPPIAFAAGFAEVRTAGPVIKFADKGCIIGYLFTRTNPSRRIEHLEPAQWMRIIQTGGRSLLSDYWGGYVAIILPSEGKANIVRDPSGIMPCYWKQDRVRNSFSNAIGSVAPREAGVSIDVQALAHFLASPQFSECSTGLDGVIEILPGEAIAITGTNTSRSAWWSPWHYADHDPHLSFEDAAHLVRDEASNCINAWASCFDGIVIGVSGGLDSSIVATITAQRAPDVRCLNMYSDDADGDERKYAKVLAHALGLPITTFRFSLGQIDISRSPLPNRPWPNAPFFWETIIDAHNKLQADQHYAAIFSGNGGDNVFCSLRSTAPFLDRFMVEGPGTGLKQTLLDLSDLTDTSAARILKTAWRSYQNLKKPKQEKLDGRGLSPTVMKQLSERHASHPWLAPHRGALPGKAAHIAQLASAHQSHELYPASDKSGVCHIAPLLSQPVVEACLGIPSWQWINGGKDRAVARAAFNELIPTSLIQRSGKGGPGQFFQSIYSNNRDAIIVRLHDGFLAQSGILDIRYLEKPHDPTWRGQADAQKLMELLMAENWCQWWLSRTN